MIEVIVELSTNQNQNQKIKTKISISAEKQTNIYFSQLIYLTIYSILSKFVTQ